MCRRTRPRSGIQEAIPPHLPFDETLDRIREQGGLAVIPAPVSGSRHGVFEHISKDELATADAIEVYNSRLLTGRSNRQAERFARRRGLPMTAGSDAHIAEMVGQAVTNVGTDERTSKRFSTPSVRARRPSRASGRRGESASGRPPARRSDGQERHRGAPEVIKEPMRHRRRRPRMRRRAPGCWRLRGRT